MRAPNFTLSPVDRAAAMGATYSPTWFDTFLPADDPPSVEREVVFVLRYLPLPAYRRVLDVACGVGRHARALASHGYEALGIDRSEDAIRAAREGTPDGARFLVHDMADLDALEEEAFDAVVCLWQSFGYVERDERAVLAAMTRRLRPGGRLLLDVYNREAIAGLPTEEVDVRRGRQVRTIRALEGDRLRVRLAYSDSEDRDEFEWRVFTPEELVAKAAGCGLSPVLACAWFDAEIPASAEHVRMQLLLERRDGASRPATEDDETGSAGR